MKLEKGEDRYQDKINFKQKEILEPNINIDLQIELYVTSLPKLGRF